MEEVLSSNVHPPLSSIQTSSYPHTSHLHLHLHHCKCLRSSSLLQKHCAIKKGFTVTKLQKKLFFSFSTFFTSLLALIFLIWIILHPSKPHFSLKQTDTYQLNLSGAHLLDSSIQLTLRAKNPNTKVGICYDDLQVYAEYRGQQITIYPSIPPFYQGHEDINTLTASLVESGFPVAPSFGYDVERDQMALKLVLNLKVKGRIRCKVGTWVSVRYRLNGKSFALTVLGANDLTASLELKPRWSVFNHSVNKYNKLIL